MGYIKHDAVVVTSNGNIAELDLFISTTPTPFRALFVKIPSTINGYITYFAAPDGSKEGWVDSAMGDSLRKQFVKIALKHGNVDVVVVSYGGDYGSEVGTTIEFSTDSQNFND